MLGGRFAQCLPLSLSLGRLGSPSVSYLLPDEFFIDWWSDENLSGKSQHFVASPQLNIPVNLIFVSKKTETEDVPSIFTKEKVHFTPLNDSLCPLNPLNKISAQATTPKYFNWSNLPPNKISLFYFSTYK
jgi:hypothetical protein